MMKDQRQRVRISVIIPAYNEERYITRCLDALAAQTVQPYEVIVVDNNSTDSTAGLARQYPFVRVVTERQQGRVFARNAGFDTARGEILARIDADSIVPKYWIAHLTHLYSSAAHKETAWTGGCYFYNVRLGKMQGWFQGQIAYRWNYVLLGHYILFGSNMALPRHIWKKLSTKVCIRNDIHEDLDLAIHVHRAGYPIEYQEGVKVGIRMSGATLDQKAHLHYMMWWPNTLRAHHKWTWIFGWFGAVAIWSITPLERVVDTCISALLRQKRKNKL